MLGQQLDVERSGDRERLGQLGGDLLMRRMVPM
jgi:hypothetical protein